MTHQFFPDSPPDIRMIRRDWHRVAILPMFNYEHWEWIESNIEGRYAILDNIGGNIGSFYLEKENDAVLFRLTWL